MKRREERLQNEMLEEEELEDARAAEELEAE